MAFGRRGILGSTLNAWASRLRSRGGSRDGADFCGLGLLRQGRCVGFASIDPELEQSAALDGPAVGRYFRHVTLPLASAALLSGAVMTWARALGEFGATIIFCRKLPRRTADHALAIYLGFELDLNVP